ncbi:MAG: hypothetical protein ACRDQU_18225 [Pseudonocardiaceae bacterium]
MALAVAPEQPQEAWELVQAEPELARRAGAPRAIGVALRVCGLLTEGKDGIELLEQSVTMLELTPMRLELAHSLTELGAALRRAGRAPPPANPCAAPLIWLPAAAPPRSLRAPARRHWLRAPAPADPGPPACTP